ncbi:MAG TPA: N-acetylmuramic acid 6-phosphate etherase [Jatrophihabitans sp.]
MTPDEAAAAPIVPALDLLSTSDVVGAVISGQAHVAAVVAGAQTEIAAAADLIAQAYLAGGRLILLGAGTSGRLAVMEAAEVPGTYGIDPARILARVAGGGADQLVGSDAAEDEADLGRQDVAALKVGQGDVLVAVAASGRTPYTLCAAETARSAGARIVSVTTVPGSPLAALADVVIEVPVGEEVVSGSTRLAAGTAQKLVLNALTTTAMVRVGRVHEHYMVDVVAANDKLRDRISGVVAASTGTELGQARSALERCDWNARAAIVHLLTDLDPAQARATAAAHRTVREAVDAAR